MTRPGRPPRGWPFLVEVPALLGRTLYSDVRRRGLERPAWRDLHPPADPPIFVVGAPRSGTTFLGNCLDAVQSISYHYEPPLARAALRRLMWGEWTPERTARVYRLTYRALRLLDGRGVTSRVADKTPENVFALPQLVRWFPGATVVHLIRDGRDVALSLVEKPWLRGSATDDGRVRASPKFWVEPDRREEFCSTSDLHRCLWAWRRYTEAGLEGRSLGCRYTEVRYEALVRDPVGTGSSLLGFLGVHAHDDRAAFLAALERAHTESVGRWRMALSEADTALAQREIGPLLDLLGYPS